MSTPSTYDYYSGSVTVDISPEKTKKIAELEERVTRQAREIDDLRDEKGRLIERLDQHRKSLRSVQTSIDETFEADRHLAF